MHGKHTRSTERKYEDRNPMLKIHISSRTNKKLSKLLSAKFRSHRRGIWKDTKRELPERYLDNGEIRDDTKRELLRR